MQKLKAFFIVIGKTMAGMAIIVCLTWVMIVLSEDGCTITPMIQSIELWLLGVGAVVGLIFGYKLYTIIEYEWKKPTKMEALANAFTALGEHRNR